jgi:hypothetical protein
MAATRRAGYRFWRVYLPLAFVLLASAGIGCIGQQQLLRSQAVEPQLELAEVAAQRLAAGAPPAAVLPQLSVELAGEQSPFLMVFDAAGRLTASSARLHGRPPALPPGVLAFTARHRQHRLSWQPEPGVRHALVLVAIPGKGFVAAGRSLRETERRKRALLHWYLVGSGAGLATLALLLWLASAAGDDRAMTGR